MQYSMQERGTRMLKKGCSYVENNARACATDVMAKTYCFFAIFSAKGSEGSQQGRQDCFQTL